jgi:hypothetical protein
MSDRAFESLTGIVRQLGEREGISVVLERDAMVRESTLFMTLRPRTYHQRTSISDNAIEDTMPIAIVDDLHAMIDEGAQALRGSAIAELASRPFKMRGTPNASKQNEHGSLVVGLLSALDHCGDMDEASADLVAKRLESILDKHADTATKERLALRLMAKVEAVPR